MARNLGEGHRVIHSVAGSGKTLVLLYRYLYFAETTARPVLVLCFNITLENYIRECIEREDYRKKYTSGSSMTGAMSLCVSSACPSAVGALFDMRFAAFESAVEKGLITDAGYDAVLIDEEHDFDRRWLSLIARLFDNASRSLLLMYDDAQSFYRWERSLNFSLASVGIQAQGRISVLRINYRNPRRILNFAYAFARDYFDKHHNHEVPLVLPEASGEDGNIPDIVQFRSALDEARHVISWLKENYTLSGRWGVCPTQFSATQLRTYWHSRRYLRPSALPMRIIRATHTGIMSCTC